MAAPVDPHARWVLVFRWVVFLLAAAAVIRQIVLTGDYSSAGGPFKYLTNWALLLSFFCASRMLALTERRSDRLWLNAVCVTAVVNVMTVYLYWSFRLDDPAQIDTGRRLPIAVDMYLHLAGPMLQCLDSVFLHRAFRFPGQATIWLLAAIATYLTLIERVVAPASITPYGSATSGLPYPFLNNLDTSDRLWFYLEMSFAAVVVLLAFTVVTHLIGTPRKTV